MDNYSSMISVLSSNDKAKAETISQRMTKLFATKFNPNELDRLAERGKISQRAIQLIRDITPFLRESYPDRWDIQLGIGAIPSRHTNTYGYNNSKIFTVFNKLEIVSINIIIHYPIATITNRDNYTFNIKDLYVKYRILNIDNNNSRFYLKQIQGLRTTVSSVEFNQGFSHSHLPSSDFRNNKDNRCHYYNFCTGTGDINVLTSEYNSENDIDFLKATILMGDNFISWESTDTNPFMRISGLCEKSFIDGENSSVGRLSDNTASDKSIYMLRKIGLGMMPEIDWKYSNGKLEIIDNEKLDTFLRYFHESHYYKDNTGRYFRVNNIENSASIGERPEYTIFRNKKVHFKVEPSARILNITNMKTYLHPKIKKYFKKNLEHYANSYKLKKACISRLSESLHAK